MLVKEIMTQNPVCCTADTGLQEAAKIMVDHDCGCVPIVDGIDSGRPVGIITDRDICCRAVAEGKNPLDLTAGDIMTKNVVTVSPDTSVEDCCNLMEDNQIRRIAVIDGSGACVGIVAQADIAVNASGQKIAEVVQEVSKATA